MDSKKYLYRDIGAYIKEFPDYSLPEILYSILSCANLKKISELLEVTEKDLITAAEKSKHLERDDYKT